MQRLLKIVCAVMLISQSACASVSHCSFCRLYTPVYTATADTEATLQQVDRNNALWLHFCSGDARP